LLGVAVAHRPFRCLGDELPDGLHLRGKLSAIHLQRSTPHMAN
jgi:hypothetical protein